MKKLTNKELRKIWFDFWQEKNHEVIESASLIPHNDPSLLWINAGITPLKKYFDGSVIPNNSRIASIQKCMRTTDIENVGKTARHHTFFEMMGNFSIGDYFKEEAIFWAWEFLTDSKWLNFPKEKLYITIYTTDDETFNIWTKLGVSPDNIIRLKENFWEIGPGPSGPCSEIFFDRGDAFDPENIGLKLLEEDIENDRYIEIWNIVFSMYNAKEGLIRSAYPELPKKNIDTGMGFERILAILQEGETNYDTDLFIPIMNKITEVSNVPYEGQMAFKVIADHIRTVTFALSDGASFGNTGRNYVLRRLLRRAVRYSKKLEIDHPYLKDLVPVIVKLMNETYPDLEKTQEQVMNKIEIEEKLFYQTLVSGEKRLNELFETSKNKHISGEEAFKLYDTYGFPFELTLEYATDAGYTVSLEEFNDQMAKQRQLARNSRTKKTSMNNQNLELLEFSLENNFVGYDKSEIETNIIALFDGDKFVNSITDEGYVVLRDTPFYIEAGGQVSDVGTISTEEITADVLDGFKGPRGQYFHYVKFDGQLSVNSQVNAKIDELFRKKVIKNHSTVHLLQRSLQEILGESVLQAGSRVDDNTLRFDFTYDGEITKEEVIKVEELVNTKIKTNSDVVVELMTLEEAKSIGALALFDDKYGDKVRVVKIVDSIELCGGTHVKNTSEIEKFAISNLESKGSGVYRVTGTTSDNINNHLFEAIKPYNDEMIKLLNKAKDIINQAHDEEIELYFDFEINHDQPTSYKDVLFNLEEAQRLKRAINELEQSYLKEKTKKSLNDLSQFEEQIIMENNLKHLVIRTDDYEPNILKSIIDELIAKHDNLFVFIANVTGDNSINFISKASLNLKDQIHCGNLVKEASIKVGGNGGGNPSFAQGGGTNVALISEVLATVLNVVKNNK